MTLRSSGARYLTEPGPTDAAQTIPMSDTTGRDAVSLLSTGPGDLVAQLNAAARMHWWPWVAGVSCLAAALAQTVPWLAVTLLVLGAIGTAFVARAEGPRHRVQVTYDLDDSMAVWFSTLTSNWSRFTGLGGAWRVQASGAVDSTYQRKTNAGATAVVSRVRAKFLLPAPRILQTNVDAPSVSSGSSALYLLPDRLLVKTGRRWSDVDYGQLTARAYPQQFIEGGTVPRDGQHVGTTWQYVNVRGGPDRRFKNNRQLPVMRYGRLELTSGQGLRWIVDLSQAPLAGWLASTIGSRPSI